MKLLQRYSLLLTILLPWIASSTPNSSETCENGLCADRDCKDQHKECKDWASTHMCTKNPLWMIENCKFSCDACPSLEKMKSYEDAEEIYAPFDDYDENNGELANLLEKVKEYGVAQDVKRGKRQKIAHVLKNTMEYMESIEDTFSESVLEICVNQSPSCAIWAARGKCKSDADVSAKCGPICNACHLIAAIDLDDTKSRQIDEMPAQQALEALTEYGVDQDIDGEELELTMSVVYLTLKYMENLRGNVTKDCRNENELCAYWAAMGECIENEQYMYEECGPVCRFCVT